MKRRVNFENSYRCESRQPPQEQQEEQEQQEQEQQEEEQEQQQEEFASVDGGRTRNFFRGLRGLRVSQGSDIFQASISRSLRAAGLPILSDQASHKPRGLATGPPHHQES